MSLSTSAFARRAVSLMDLTDLSDDCTAERVDALVKRARSLSPSVAALCLWPRFVAQARQGLAGTSVHVATVVNFPAGGENLHDTLRETDQALHDGADEIDLVLPWRALLEGRIDEARAMLRTIRQATAGKAHLKVILETGELKSDAAIRSAARLAIEEGADFLKTSTGKTAISATPEAARLLLEEIRNSGQKIGLKASGGIRSLEQARLYFDLAEDMMGPGWVTADHFRYGASGLLESLCESF